MKRTLAAAALVLCILLVLTPSAGAASSPLDVTPPDAASAPELRATVTLPAELAGQRVPPDAFTLREDGENRAITVTRLAGDQLQVVLAIDTSGSMAGAPLEAAKDAALRFLDRAPVDTPIAVVGFGDEAYLASRFTTDREALRDAVESLRTSAGTGLYDAVGLAARLFDTSGSGQRSVVLLADGDDTGSRADARETTAALSARRVQLESVGFATSTADTSALRELALASGGSFTTAADAGALARTYDRLASSLADRYSIAWRSHGTGPTSLVLRLRHAGVDAEERITLDLGNERTSTGGSALGSTWAFVVGVGCLFLALLMGGRALLDGGRSGRKYALTAGRAVAPGTGRSISGVAGRSATLAEGLLDRWGKRLSLNRALDRAGIVLRPGEFLVLVGSIGVGALLLGSLLGGPAVGLLAVVTTVVICRLYLSFRSDRRRARFSDQLGDSLQLLAGSLRAGYGLLQAIDAVAQEADEPTRQEFRRLVIETRLGRDLADALHSMADRVGGEDFKWIVQAIEIHREVGGDLAQVLDTVAATIRERNQMRRQVQALSAEGRLSANVLMALPVLLFIVLRTLNPGYLSELGHGTGLLLAVGGVVSLGVGAVWLRQMCRLEY